MISFFVAGVPVPKGSAKAFMNKGMRFPVVTQDNKEKQTPWASSIGYAAQSIGANVGKDSAVLLEVFFHMPRPKGHYGTGKNAGTVKATSPFYHTNKPDLDKLVRCVKDALTGVAWGDDSQVAEIVARKFYSDKPGASISISRL